MVICYVVSLVSCPRAHGLVVSESAHVRPWAWPVERLPAGSRLSTGPASVYEFAVSFWLPTLLLAGRSVPFASELRRRRLVSSAEIVVSVEVRPGLPPGHLVVPAVVAVAGHRLSTGAGLSVWRVSVCEFSARSGTDRSVVASSGVGLPPHPLAEIVASAAVGLSATFDVGLRPRLSAEPESVCEPPAWASLLSAWLVGVWPRWACALLK